MKHSRRIKRSQRKHYDKNVFRYIDKSGNRIVVVIDNGPYPNIEYSKVIGQYNYAQINLKDYEQGFIK